MPILHIRALAQNNPHLVETALKKACAAIAAEYGCPLEHVWATWEEIKPGYYVEGETPARAQPASSHPPIAQLTCFEKRTSAEIDRILLAGAGVLAETLSLPNNVFLSYVDASGHKVIAGGELIGQ